MNTHMSKDKGEERFALFLWPLITWLKPGENEMAR
jgi:hypothetical protein